ncbi:response regulator [Methylomonas sp. AM2-LC]|uniref:response regulator n=1 Tax=Methylomonas sp. AM2-LC TaxID=3153301 RepID=UPI0032636E67
MKFLIVDDSRAVQAIIKRALEQSGIAGMEFKMAMNGEQAMTIIPDWQPDLVITDWHMPTMTGIELLKLLRQSNFGHIKVGFVTTETAAHYLDEAINHGACFVINKPCSDVELQNAVFSVFPKAKQVNAHDSKSADDKLVVFAANSKTELLEFLKNELQTTLTLTPVLRKPLEELVGPMVIGAYRLQDGKNVVGICLLDKSAAILIGGKMSGKAVKDIAKFIKTEGLEKEFSDHAIKVLSKCANIVFSANTNNALELGASNVVNRPSEKLSAVIENSASRFDYIISHPDFGNGLISIICN